MTSLCPLEVLKDGFTKLKKSVGQRKADLQAHLAQKKKISPAEEEWLNNTGNLVDEEHVIDMLNVASDYKLGMERLSDTDKTLMKHLQEAASAEVSKMRKHACLIQCECM